MFHKIKSVTVLPKYKLSVKFCEGKTKIYDASQLFAKIPKFKKLQDEKIFNKVCVDTKRYGIVWNDDLDLSCDEI